MFSPAEGGGKHQAISFLANTPNETCYIFQRNGGKHALFKIAQI